LDELSKNSILRFTGGSHGRDVVADVEVFEYRLSVNLNKVAGAVPTFAARVAVSSS
jgi:hypothetical protein